MNRFASTFLTIATMTLALDSAASGQTAIPFCAHFLRDAAQPSNCIQASTFPVDGKLLPLGEYLFVTPGGNIGIGTKLPQAALHVAAGSGRILLQDMDVTDPYTADPYVTFSTGDGTTIGYVGDVSPTGDVVDLTAVTGQARLVTGSSEPVVIMTAYTERMRVDGTGNVGIGTTSPSQRLHVAGNICATGSIAACSDGRFKQDVSVIAGGLDAIAKLNGVRYTWKRAEFPDSQFPEGTQVGFIAQDVLAVIPEVVSEGSDGYLSVDYARLSPVLVEAIKELDSENARLKQRIEELSRVQSELQGKVDLLMSKSK